MIHIILLITNLLAEGNIVLSDNLFINKKVCQLNLIVLSHINMSLYVEKANTDDFCENNQGTLAIHIHVHVYL